MRVSGCCTGQCPEGTRAVFPKHNLLNEFDHWSDVSVWHKVRVVPTSLSSLTTGHW